MPKNTFFLSRPRNTYIIKLNQLSIKKIIIIQLPVHKKIQLPHLIHNNYIK